MQNNYCSRPWTELHIEDNGNITPCCVMPSNRFPMGSGLKAYMNGEPLASLKKELLAGSKPDQCSICWDTEASGLKSHRKQESHTNTIKNIHVRLNNVCNFKCRMCNPRFSSSWAIENKKHNIFIEDTDLAVDVFEVVPDLLYFIQRLIETKQLQRINISGGEPLITEANHKLLTFLIDNKLTDVIISYSSNLSRLDYKKYDLLELWSHFKQVTIHASCDGWGPQVEYSRTGFNSDTFLKNCLLARKHVTSIKCIVNNYSIWSLPTLVKLAKALNLPIDFSPCFLPEHLNPQTLPVEEKLKLKSLYAGTPILEELYDSYISIDKPIMIKEFIAYNLQLDKYRKSNFFASFPEYGDYNVTIS